MIAPAEKCRAPLPTFGFAYTVTTRNIARMADAPTAAAWIDSPGGETRAIRDRFSFGRTPDCDLTLQSEKISRRHAMIQRQAAVEFWISDLGSRNGTYVNGRPLTQPQRLRDGDRIGLGDGEFIFRQSAGGPIGETPGNGIATTMQDIRQMSCWFLIGDIEGYTKMSHTLAAAELGRTVGAWVAACRDLIETHGGNLNKFLGDGFFAYWPCREESPERVARAALGLRGLQDAEPPFRFILHHGSATFSGQLSGEVVIGPEVNFAFRMEKLAKDLGLHRLLSAAAAGRLPPPIAIRPAGKCCVAGFSGEGDFHTFD